MPTANEKPQRMISCPRCGKSILPSPSRSGDGNEPPITQIDAPVTDSDTRSSSHILRMHCPECGFALPPALVAPIDFGFSPQFSPPELSPGEILGSYKIIGRIGKGGMGTVYRAEHTRTRRPVALKSLTLCEDTAQLQEHSRRFLREARLAAAINHPNVVKVLGFIKKDDRYHIVQEFMAGGSLKALLQKKGKLEESQVLEIARSTANALREAAKIRIVHRDIKPDNIMLNDDGIIKLADLGLATQTHEAEAPISLAELDDLVIGQITICDYSASLTMSNMAMGTPAYMAPEQAVDSRSVDQRADFYSLGATLYHLICGEPPFICANLRDLLMQHRQAAIPDPRTKAPGISSALARVIVTCLAKHPDERFQNADELSQEIERICAHRTTHAPGSHHPTRAHTANRSTSLSARTSVNAAQSVAAPNPHQRRPSLISRIRDDVGRTFTRDNIQFLLTVLFALILVILIYLWSDARIKNSQKKRPADAVENNAAGENNLNSLETEE